MNTRLFSGSEVFVLVLITYDVKTETQSGRKRLSRISRICCNYGQRVQNSVFECDINAEQLVVLRNKLLKVISEGEDSLRIYNLGNNYNKKIEQYGCKKSYDPEGVMIL